MIICNVLLPPDVGKERRGASVRPSHRRLVAVLHVAHRFESHREGDAWCRTAGLPPPSCCPFQGLRRSGSSRGEPCLKDWDLGYQLRARKHSTFLACRALPRPPCAAREPRGRPVPSVRAGPADQVPPTVDGTQVDNLLMSLGVPIAS